MAATIIWDVVQQAGGELDAIQSRVIRPCVVKGMTDSSTADPDAIFKAYDAIVAAGVPLGTVHPTRSNFILRRFLITPISQTSALVRLVYETGLFNGPASVVIITDRTVNTTYESDLMPGTRIPIRIHPTLVTFIDHAGDPQIRLIPGDTVTLKMRRPTRAIGIQALIYGTPGAGYGDLVGCVNDNDWPTTAVATDYPIGYWMLDGWTTSYSKYSGFYQLDALAISRVDEDWSETVTLVDEQTGKKVPVDAADITAMIAPPYSVGEIWPALATDPDTYDGKGIARFGYAQTTNFATIFGF